MQYLAWVRHHPSHGRLVASRVTPLVTQRWRVSQRALRDGCSTLPSKASQRTQRELGSALGLACSADTSPFNERCDAYSNVEQASSRRRRAGLDERVRAAPEMQRCMRQQPIGALHTDSLQLSGTDRFSGGPMKTEHGLSRFAAVARDMTGRCHRATSSCCGSSSSCLASAQ